MSTDQASDEVQQELQHLRSAETQSPTEATAEGTTGNWDREVPMDMEFCDRLDKLEARVDRLEAKSVHQHVTQYTITSQLPILIPFRRDINAIARIQNAYARTPSDLLIPLVNLTTGDLILDMPATSNDINHMTGKRLCNRFPRNFIAKTSPSASD